MTDQIRILGTGQLLTLARRLRSVSGAGVQQNFQRRIRRAAEPLHRDLRDTMRNMPISGSGRGAGSHSGRSPTTRPLRATIAAAIRITVRTSSNPSATVYVDKGLLPRDLKNMPGAINDAPGGRIRHPVYGNRHRWATTYVTPLWWSDTVRRHESRMRAEVERITEDVRRQLGG